MSKQTIEIEVPDGWRVARYGQPQCGEHYLTAQGEVLLSTLNYCGRPWMILERDPDYVESIEVRLKSGWIARNENGCSFWFPHKPEIRSGANYWSYEVVGGCNCGFFINVPVDVDLGDDWRNSLRRVK